MGLDTDRVTADVAAERVTLDCSEVIDLMIEVRGNFMHPTMRSIEFHMRYDVKLIKDIVRKMPCGAAFVERKVLQTVPLRYTVNETEMVRDRKNEDYSPVIAHEFKLTSCHKVPQKLDLVYVKQSKFVTFSHDAYNKTSFVSTITMYIDSEEVLKHAPVADEEVPVKLYGTDGGDWYILPVFLTVDRIKVEAAVEVTEKDYGPPSADMLRFLAWIDKLREFNPTELEFLQTAAARRRAFLERKIPEPPTPTLQVASVGNDGTVTLLFNQDMLVPEDLSKVNYEGSLRFILTSIDDNSQILGIYRKPVEAAAKSDSSSKEAGRRLVALTRNCPDVGCASTAKVFYWHVAKHEPRKIEIKLEFEKPSAVSKSTEGSDQLEFVLLDGQMFVS